MTTTTLNTKARDNHGFEYTVVLDPSDYSHFKDEHVLRIKGTPGSWFMSTLMNHKSSRISIDAGQMWDCINFHEVLAEARKAALDTETDRVDDLLA